jgi:hypothetical protein
MRLTPESQAHQEFRFLQVDQVTCEPQYPTRIFGLQEDLG